MVFKLVCTFSFSKLFHFSLAFNATNAVNILLYIIIRVRSAFSLVASCVLLKYTRTDDVN